VAREPERRERVEDPRDPEEVVVAGSEPLGAALVAVRPPANRGRAGPLRQLEAVETEHATEGFEEALSQSRIGSEQAIAASVTTGRAVEVARALVGRSTERSVNLLERLVVQARISSRVRRRVLPPRKKATNRVSLAHDGLPRSRDGGERKRHGKPFKSAGGSPCDRLDRR